MIDQEKENRLNELYSTILTQEAFLKETDYQTIREIEGGESMSKEVKAKRAQARALINEAQAMISELEKLKEEVE